MVEVSNDEQTRRIVMAKAVTREIDEPFVAFLVEVLGSAEEPITRTPKRPLSNLADLPTFTASSAEISDTSNWSAETASCAVEVEWTEIFFPGDVNEPPRYNAYLCIRGERREGTVTMHAHSGDPDILISVDSGSAELDRIVTAFTGKFEGARALVHR